MSSTIPTALRQEVVQRAKNACEYCLLPQSTQFLTFHIDHIIAEKHGGAAATDNLSLACPDDNLLKRSDIASIDWDHSNGIVRLFHPRRDKWSQHFEIDMETGAIKPLTPEERVTVFLLQINDPERVMDRKLLIDDKSCPF